MQRLKSFIDRTLEFRSARARLLATPGRTEDDLRLLKAISLRVHPQDPMRRPGLAEHYLSVGLSAAHLLRQVVSLEGRGRQIRTILDLPCGYGRVLRFLTTLFPRARITGVDLDRDALTFCQRVFGIDTVEAPANPRELRMRQKFDLIWCGSLVTHFDELTTLSLLDVFRQCLSTHGICVFTAHGRKSEDWLRSGDCTYGLTAEGLKQLLNGYEERGYGYAPLPTSPDYGISLASPARVLALVDQSRMSLERDPIIAGWDQHQDVYIVSRVS